MVVNHVSRWLVVIAGELVITNSVSIVVFVVIESFNLSKFSKYQMSNAGY